MNAEIRPSKDLRNHYSEISRECHENRKPIIITVNGRGDTVLLGLQEFYQMQAELELLRTLSQAEEDAAQGRTASVQYTVDDISVALMEKKSIGSTGLSEQLRPMSN